MPTLPHSGRRHAPARRRLFAVLTAAFLVFQQFILLAPAASAQTRRPAAVSSSATKLRAKSTPIIPAAAKAPKSAPLTAELFFSEYVEGSSNNKALEIYNGTGAAVNLGTLGYNVQMFFNGSTTAGLTINLTGTVANGDVFVVAQSSAAAAILAQADQTNSSGWYNGDDAVVLRKGTTIIDTIGQVGNDPGTEWGTGLASTADNTIRRKSTICAGDTNSTDAFDPATEWDGFANDAFDGLGSHSATCGDAAPTVQSTNPADNATGIALGSNVSVTFSEAVNLGSGAFTISCATSGTHTFVSSTSDNITFTLNPDSDFVANEVCTVTVDDAAVTDQDASDPPDNMAADYVFDFTTVVATGTTVSVNDVSQAEGSGGGTTTFNFTVSLSTAQHGGVTMTFSTADGTATTADSDYQGFSTPVVFPNGSQSITIPVSVNADSTVEPNETFFVNLTNISGATAADGQGQGTIVNDDVTVIPIHDIQGNTTASPRVGETLTTAGIVTLLRTSSNGGAGAASGFFMQDANVDADPNTSEGIFVFTSTVPTVAVGDSVRVTGTVQEFNGLTEIGSVTNTTVLSTGNSLPAAVVLDSIILDPTALPTQPQLEKYESMRLTGTLKSVAPNDTFFDVDAVLSTVARPLREPGVEISTPSIPPDPNEATPDCCIPRWDENPERIKVDTNGRAGAPNVPYTSNVTFTNLSGPLDYSFGEYRLIPDAAPSASANMTAVAAPSPESNEFTVASYNIENFNNNATQRQKAALTIRDSLHLPDIIGTVEIFDLADLQALAAEIQSISGVTYSAHLVEQDGVSEDNDQDVGFLVKTSRVTVNSVTQEREEEMYDVPGGGTAILHDRPPLVLDATVDPAGATPQHVIVVVNHLRSFICIDADADPAVASGCDGGAADGPRVREKRRKQAESLADLLGDLQTANPGVPVMSVGDYNSYQFTDGFTDPIKTIKGIATVDNELAVDASPDLINPDFVNVIDLLPASERYSFNFEGTPQALDHHIINAAARARYTRAAIARVNSDFPEAPAATYANNAAIPERNSDHDPVISYYRLGAAQAAGSLIISEFRFRGPDPGFGDGGDALNGLNDNPGGPNAPGTEADNDEFIELYNNTDADINVSTLDGSAGWALVAADGVTRFTVPNNTIIPARGHYLAANSDGYSLDAYATPDTTYTLNIPDGDGSGIALFSTADPVNFTLDNRLDAAGYSTAPALYREGAGFPAPGAEATTDLEYSFVRKVCVFGGPGCGIGLPKDTADNASDFVVVNTVAALTTLGAKLGAPGPQGLTSPVNGNAGMPGALLDTSVSSSQPPNRVRSFVMGDPNTSNLGTLSFRRTITNNTGSPVRYLAFRIIDITTNPVPSGTADLRALDSSDMQVTVNGNPVDVRGTTVEQPPFQPNGGGLNSSMAVGFINLEENQLEDGESVSVQFLLGIMQTGGYRFYVNVEMLNDGPAPAGPVSLGSRNLKKLGQEQQQRRRPRLGSK